MLRCPLACRVRPSGLQPSPAARALACEWNERHVGLGRHLQEPQKKSEENILNCRRWCAPSAGYPRREAAERPLRSLLPLLSAADFSGPPGAFLSCPRSPRRWRPTQAPVAVLVNGRPSRRSKVDLLGVNLGRPHSSMPAVATERHPTNPHWACRHRGTRVDPTGGVGTLWITTRGESTGCSRDPLNPGTQPRGYDPPSTPFQAIRRATQSHVECGRRMVHRGRDTSAGSHHLAVDNPWTTSASSYSGVSSSLAEWPRGGYSPQRRTKRSRPDVGVDAQPGPCVWRRAVDPTGSAFTRRRPG